MLRGDQGALLLGVGKAQYSVWGISLRADVLAERSRHILMQLVNARDFVSFPEEFLCVLELLYRLEICK